MLDMTIAKSLAPLVGATVQTLRFGLDQLRRDGYRLVKVWEMSEDGVEDNGRGEMWPSLDPDHYQEDP